MLGKMQKSMIDLGVKQLIKWLKSEKEGSVSLKVEEINLWLSENAYDFFIKSEKGTFNSDDEITLTYIGS